MDPRTLTVPFALRRNAYTLTVEVVEPLNGWHDQEHRDDDTKKVQALLEKAPALLVLLEEISGGKNATTRAAWRAIKKATPSLASDILKVVSQARGGL